MRQLINYQSMIGKRYGRLVVIALGKKINSRQQLLCNCDCGTVEKSIQGKDLYNGKINSCGCSARCINTYKTIDNEAYLIITDTTLTNTIVNIDIEDIEKIKLYNWTIRKDGYVHAYIGNCKYIYLHRLLLNVLEDLTIEIDHINQNPSDNRKYNLRIASHSENSQNISLRYNNTTGNTGVYFSKKNNNWYACVSINNKSKRLGSYNNKEEAIKARCEAELLYYNDFSPLNSEKIIAENKMIYQCN